MNRPFVLTKDIQLACLPNEPPTQGDICYTSGWGRSERSKYMYVDKYRVTNMERQNFQSCFLVLFF